jgi:hypothetical protein
MSRDVLDTTSQLTTSVQLVAANRVNMVAATFLPTGQSVTMEVPMHNDLNNNVAANGRDQKSSLFANESQVRDTKVVTSDNVDGAAKATILLAWKNYDRNDYYGENPLTAKKWLLPWNMCRTWTVSLRGDNENYELSSLVGLN